LKRRDPPKHEKNGPLYPYLELDAPIGLAANSMGFGINTSCLEGMLMSITIQLVGSASAIFGEYRYTARGNGHDPIPPLVRSLLAEKVIDADVLVTVARGDLVCFGPCRAILWAEIDVVDTDDDAPPRPSSRSRCRRRPRRPRPAGSG
jgi:hypothetical protein